MTTGETKGLVFDIKKFAIHDGPGIRTTVFLKGCPLHCLWCHNPESQSAEREIFFLPGKCIGCGWCFEHCPRKCHTMENGKHVFHRESCVRCGICAEKCYAGALEIVGREMTPADVFAEVLKDKSFYDNSGGGMTLSGGEPMAQFEFSLALFRLAKANGVGTALDTSGFAPTERYAEILPYTDTVLFDIKAVDPEKHRLLTGRDNRLILENLKAIDSFGKSDIYLRCPLIPGVNDEESHLAGIASLAESLSRVKEIDVEPYHPLGIDKCSRLGRESPLPLREFASRETVEKWIAFLSSHTGVKVRKE